LSGTKPRKLPRSRKVPPTAAWQIAAFPIRFTDELLASPVLGD